NAYARRWHAPQATKTRSGKAHRLIRSRFAPFVRNLYIAVSGWLMLPIDKVKQPRPEATPTLGAGSRAADGATLGQAAPCGQLRTSYSMGKDARLRKSRQLRAPRQRTVSSCMGFTVSTAALP